MEHCSIQAVRARVAQREGHLATYGNPQASLHRLKTSSTGILNAAGSQAKVTAVKLSAEQYAALCEAVGLDPENTTVTTMVARVLEHLIAAEGEGGDPQELRAQAADAIQARAEVDRLREELGDIKASGLISKGISQGKLLGWQRDAWVKMAKTNFEETERALKAMPVKVNLSERGYAGVPSENNHGKWF